MRIILSKNASVSAALNSTQKAGRKGRDCDRRDATFGPQSAYSAPMSLPFLVFLLAWLVGMACTFLPAIPATLIIYAGAALAVLLDGFQTSDLPFLIGYGVLTLLVMSVDNLASAWGAKKYGGGKAAMWGAVVGGLVGIFLGPIGLFVGPLVGAFAAELLFAGKSLEDAGRSGWGTLVGILAGIGAKLVLHFIMGAYALWRLWEPTQSVFR